MKNLKDEIEGILVEGFATAPSRCWACEARTPKKEIAGKREQNLEHIGTITDSITSLIEQEKERAVREFVNLCHKNEIYGDTGVVIGNFIGSNKSDLECLAEQYLAERKGE